ncbi:hypothetical protein BASA50_002256 [Batrachochytrium salamandrivorans]|uniref:non-specific serine/threonine protein kinase n=1 Tax=Batrachochytrium salamandrivorans TaxID=1357716 RepID=A0ABQ8FN57_9FUNG|nr:hypothetical protein BASA50_002256 [Batrachochytrium salamandrivorans]
MFDSLLWILPHFVTQYAGQTTQGDKDDGDGVDVDQASGSKDAASLIQGTTSTTLPTTLRESNTPNQSGASSSADCQSKKDCKSGHGIRKVSKSCPHQQSPPGPQPSTLYDPSQSDEIPPFVYLGKSEAEPYRLGQKTDQYREFIASETKYFKSEYRIQKKLGQGSFGTVYLATKKSNGVKVAYKSIPYKDVDGYTLESNTSPICHLRSPLVLSDEQSVAQCMSSRPPSLSVPYEFAIQTYLSRPGYENPYVPMGFDYITLKDEFILVMKYFDEKWMDLSSYVEEKGRLDIEDARDIVRKIVEAMLSLKQQGVVHNDIHGMSQ